MPWYNGKTDEKTAVLDCRCRQRSRGGENYLASGKRLAGGYLDASLLLQSVPLCDLDESQQSRVALSYGVCLYDDGWNIGGVSVHAVPVHLACAVSCVAPCKLAQPFLSRGNGVRRIVGLNQEVLRASGEGCNLVWGVYSDGVCLRVFYQ